LVKGEVIFVPKEDTMNTYSESRDEIHAFPIPASDGE
jgi:hypothetical protein